MNSNNTAFVLIVVGFVVLMAGVVALSIRTLQHKTAPSRHRAIYLIITGLGVLALGSLISQSYLLVRGELQSYKGVLPPTYFDSFDPHWLANVSAIVIGLANIFIAVFLLKWTVQPRSVRVCLWSILIGGSVLVLPAVLYLLLIWFPSSVDRPWIVD